MKILMLPTPSVVVSSATRLHPSSSVAVATLGQPIPARTTGNKEGASYGFLGFYHTLAGICAQSNQDGDYNTFRSTDNIVADQDHHRSASQCSFNG